MRLKLSHMAFKQPNILVTPFLWGSMGVVVASGSRIAFTRKILESLLPSQTTWINPQMQAYSWGNCSSQPDIFIQDKNVCSNRTMSQSTGKYYKGNAWAKIICALDWPNQSTDLSLKTAWRLLPTNILPLTWERWKNCTNVWNKMPKLRHTRDNSSL